jgi:urea transport system permease protein
MGMHLMRQIGTRGVYGNAILPDFMVFLNWKELPWYWHGFDNPLFAILMALAVPGVLAWVFGWFAFRSRVSGVYLSIITQALTYALLLAFFRNDMGFGGNNGLTDFKDIFGFRCNPMASGALLIATALFLAAALLVARTLRPAGSKDRGEDTESCTCFGYRPERYKLFVFAVGGDGRTAARFTCRR